MNAAFTATSHLASRHTLRDTKSCGGAWDAALSLVSSGRSHFERNAAEKPRF
jgi:hypothetical protein